MTTTEITTSRVRNRLRRAPSHERRLVRGGKWVWALAGLCRDLRDRARTLFLLAAALAAARQLLIGKTVRLQATRVPAPAMNQATVRSGSCGSAAASDSKSDALRRVNVARKRA